MSLECSAWLHEFRHWLKMMNADTSAEHQHALLNDSYTSAWANVFLNKLHHLGFSREFIAMHDHKIIKAIIEKQIKLLDHHHSMMNTQKTCSPLKFGLNFGNLTIPKYRLIFAKARFNCLSFCSVGWTLQWNSL